MIFQPQPLFIPKKTPAILSPTQRVGGRNVNLFAILAFLVFFATAGFGAFVFFYKSALVKTITDMDASLVLARKSFDPEFIAEASRLNARIEGAERLLANHRALSPLFDILEGKTLESVRFRDFNFNALGEKEIVVGMAGQAKSFNAVALQSDVFGEERSFKDQIFSNFSLDEQGDVTFNFKTTVDAKLLLYRETLLTSLDPETKDAAGEFDTGEDTSNE